jgi:hypothetical protein
LVEGLKESEIKRYLTAKSISYKDDIRGLKSLEVFIRNIFGDTTNMISPLFYLNDLRIWADHKNSQGKYDDVLINLGLQPDATFAEVYNGLLIRISSFMKSLLENVLKNSP